VIDDNDNPFKFAVYNRKTRLSPIGPLEKISIWDNLEDLTLRAKDPRREKQRGKTDVVQKHGARTGGTAGVKPHT
jgi:hypothetical protein